ncbi:dehydrogenase/reductase SDR family member 12-like [Acipenser oxyrinchus oxyrinchus]|uniref:Dehydrogenase/reductase SDR family member 12-like n=1 Tax=Acipenser oxyrinchus oxyrinchus TaxID=40147 RepID=A0AAD8G494_ACIOX|nr:dehydrogenase/reductase SDR family member 12-like [Acipenser oxyrinchus oxyrinchus]
MSLYRNTIWFFKGIQEYTRGGYEAAARLFVEKDMDVTVSDRSYMITGANSGLGKASALEIAKKGGAVHLVCRNKDRAEEARAEIAKESGNNDIFVHILDMSEAKKVWEFAEGFKKDHKSLNVLINNAGCMVNQRELNAEGMEMNFATNTLGTFILTKSLIPLLEKSDSPRVITVSSGGMLIQKLDTEDLQAEKGHFDGTLVYAQNKRQQVVMTDQWAKVHSSIHFSAMHPGWADTPAVRSAMPDFHRSMKNKLRTAEQGADTIVWLALSEAARTQPSGLFFQDRKAVSTHLPLAWTRSTPEEEQKFMKILDDLANSFQPQ